MSRTLKANERMQSTLAESTINEAVLQAPAAHILYGCAIHRIIYYPADKY